MKMNRVYCWLILGLASFLGFSSQAQAQLVLQGQFIPGSNFTGPQTTAGGVLNTAGNTWNRIGSNGNNGYSGQLNVNNTPLRSATGDITNVSFDASIAFVAPNDPETGTSYQGMNAAGPGSPYNGFNTGSANSLSLMNNYAYSRTSENVPNTFSFSGLSAGTYNFYAYTTGDGSNGSNGRQLTMEVEGIALTSLAMTNVATRNSFTEGVNYLLFSNIVVTSNGGSIAGNWWSPLGYEANWNGFQLQQVQAVPEPGTMILTGLALAGMGGAAWRRRKNKTTPVETPEATV